MKQVKTGKPEVRDIAPGAGAPVVAGKQIYHKDLKLSGAPVTHSYAALALYTKGKSSVEMNGTWELSAGDLLLVPAGAPHQMLEVSQPEIWGLAFCVPCFASDGALQLLEPFERVRSGGSPVVRVPSERHAFLEGLFQELAQITEGAGRGVDTEAAIQRSLLTLILAEVERSTSALQLPAAQGGSVVMEALRFIERNCLGPLTLQEVASRVGRSPAHLTHALSQATGRSAVQWIVSGRMAEARRLLLHSNERVESVAERIGYADMTHFIRLFRREHGLTPAAWRAAQGRGK